MRITAFCVFSGLLAFVAICVCPASAEGLLGHWKFDHPLMGTARDSSAGGHHAKVHGAVPVRGSAGGTQGPLQRFVFRSEHGVPVEGVEGNVDGALRFDGKDDFVELGDLGRHEAVTIAFWVKPSSGEKVEKIEKVEKAEKAENIGRQGLVASDTWEEGVLHIPLRDRRIDVALHMGGKRRGRVRSLQLQDDVWYHVAVVIDVGQGRFDLFVNGMLQGSDGMFGFTAKIKLLGMVVGRVSNKRDRAGYFQGDIDDVRVYGHALDAEEIQALCPAVVPLAARDSRNIRTGHVVPFEGYCDQPYVVITKDGNWLCVLTTGRGKESKPGQHVVATISCDQGRTWSELIDIEPADGPATSWVVPLVIPGGRVYAFYNYNGDDIRTDGREATLLGWYVFKYSDDNGRTWSKRRYRLPMRVTACDRDNDWGGKVQMFWGIDKPSLVDGSVLFAFTKIGKYLIDDTEGWFYRSDNILDESDPAKIEWLLLPDGDVGLKNPAFGSIQTEHNIVALGDGSIYCMGRTAGGYPCHAYSRDKCRTWTMPEYATYTPGGKKMKTPRACPKVWRADNGKFLFWYHNHSDVRDGGWHGRNPVWISGGIEKDGWIHWSQPELLLYRPYPNRDGRGMSYPDLIEQNGRYWVTETQKTITRVHELDKALLEGLWSQGEVKTAARRGLALELNAKQLQAEEAQLPGPIDLTRTGGMAIDFRLKLDDLAAGQVVLDSRGPCGRGIALTTTEAGTLRFDISDGEVMAAWDCDPGLLKPGTLHHVVVIVDAGPKLISFVVDGVVCDGGDFRCYGWSRYRGDIGDVGGSGKLRAAPALQSLRVYRRPLRTSEAIANFHAGQ